MQYLCSLTTLPHVSFMNYFSPKRWVHFRRRNVEYIMYFIAEGKCTFRRTAWSTSCCRATCFLQPYLEHVGTRPAECAYYFAHFSNLSLLPFDYGEGTALEIADQSSPRTPWTACSILSTACCRSYIRVRDEADARAACGTV